MAAVAQSGLGSAKVNLSCHHPLAKICDSLINNNKEDQQQPPTHSPLPPIDACSPRLFLCLCLCLCPSLCLWMGRILLQRQGVQGGHVAPGLSRCSGRREELERAPSLFLVVPESFPIRTRPTGG